MINVIEGDCIERLKAMPEKLVNTCVTSPPYFGLRDYGHDGQIGLEPTPDEYVTKMVDVFREVRRVLRDDGTLWLNLGDSYARQGGKVSEQPRHWDGRKRDAGAMHATRHVDNMPGFKPKDLIGIPWRVAFALQADGWYLRQDIIWHKPNPMPESVRDRCTKAHEYIFLLSKSERYYFDSEAMKEEGTGRIPGNKKAQKIDASRNDGGTLGIFAAQQKPQLTRNRRSVWTVTTKPFKGAHFATFPPDLIEPCILAGCPKDGTVLDPFGGSGTTGIVAKKHGRKAVLIELNPTYAEMARQRISQAQPQQRLV